MTAQRASSTGLPVRGSMRATRVSRRGGSAARVVGPMRGWTTDKASGPLTRTTPTAPSPTGVAMATIVARSSDAGDVPGLPARVLPPPGAIHVVLLQDLEHVRDRPVEHQAGGQAQEHERE